MNYTLIAMPSEIDENALASIAYGSAITSYARIYMHCIISGLLKKGVNIYYMDTDSIIIDQELDKTLVSQTELGLFKKEQDIAEGIFILPKTVAYKNKDGKVIIKAKGIAHEQFDWKWFKQCIENNFIIKKATRLLFKKQIDTLQITQQDLNIEIKEPFYDKRQCIFDNNKWIDTKPLVINK
uniref:Putative DNA polymerase n=1 Tax=Bulbochaete rectangularis var. hiloensis TaxID=55990 RepID=A0A6M4SP28_9CHLO|nr:putative DNA polymerase [Bulbochaete rectangularis var. hiloensis]